MAGDFVSGGAGNEAYDSTISMAMSSSSGE